MFQRLRTARLTLRGTKCHIGLSEVTYLGHVFSESGMKPDDTKLKVVRNWPPPTDVTAVRQFLGLASYYRRYIPGFASIAAPLHSLTQKGVSFVWTSECQQSFDALKQKLVKSPVLTYPRFDSRAPQFMLYTDASNVGVGVVLEQEGRVIGFASRTLSKAERNYSVIQREWLAIVYGTKQYRQYLLGRPFVL